MLSPAEYSELTRTYPILSQLPADLQDSLQQKGSMLEAFAGQVLFAADSPFQRLPLPVNGVARMVKPVRGGRELVLYRVHPGDVCFLTAVSLLSGNRYPGQLISETSMTGVWLPLEVFQHIVENSQPFRRFVFAFLAEQLTDLMNLIDEIISEQLDQRLALVLIRKGSRIQTTHQMLADEVGTVREVVSRILKQFETRGILVLGRRKIWIKNPQALHEIAYPDGDSDH